MSKASTPIRRSGCPISFSLDVFGDRWTLLVLRDLLLKGKRHFRELAASDEGIATNILTDRLKRLERSGIIVRSRDENDGRQVIYSATEKGLGLIPVLLELAAWGATHDPETDAPSDFVPSFQRDREAVIARTQALQALPAKAKKPGSGNSG